MRTVEQIDPFRVLGLARDASLREVRLAYRRAVLRYHPDSCRGNRVEAVRKFRQVVEAYQAILRYYGAGGWTARVRPRPRAYSPQDLAFFQMDWPFVPQKVALAAHDETALFTCFWALAMVIAAGASYLLVGGGVVNPGAAMLVYLVTYLGILGGTVLLLQASRRVIWLIGQQVMRKLLPRG